jgi:ribosomal protein S18 acetylase RimI-like enzyme
MVEYRTTLKGINPKHLDGFFVGWKNTLTKEQHYTILKNSSFFVLAYDNENDKVVGFVNALCDSVHFAFIPMIEVLPEYQHKGIGTNLLKEIFELLKPMTCIDLTCDIQLQGFYERFGMKKSHGMVFRKYL